MYFLSSFVLTGDRYVRLALVAALTQILFFYCHILILLQTPGLELEV